MAFEPVRGPNGELYQSAMPKTGARSIMRANGLLVRGVVIRTYAYDQGGSPMTPDPGLKQAAIYCDVMTYSSLPGNRTNMLLRCLVSQERAGMHDGDIWIPRAATMDITGAPLNLNTATNPANMDGDHVLIGFMDDDLALPVVLRCIPHPQTDFQDTGHPPIDAPGQRLKLSQPDGHPRMWRHHGTFFGVDTDGNSIWDTTRAFDGQFEPDGSEPPPLLSGTNGNYTVRLPTQSSYTIDIIQDPGNQSSPVLAQIQLLDGTFKVTFTSGPTFALTGEGAGATLTLGDGSHHVAIVEQLQALWGQMVTYIEAATVLTALGPSGPIVGNSGPAPAWDPSINSTKVSIPNG